MWDRFEISAKRVVFQARYEAAKLRSEYIEDRHLLLGVRRTAMELPVPRPATSPSSALAATAARVRFSSQANTGQLRRPENGPILLGQSAKQVLHSAGKEAVSLNHRHVHWDHLLLALSRTGSAPVRGALTDAGLTPTVIQESLDHEPFWRVT